MQNHQTAINNNPTCYCNGINNTWCDLTIDDWFMITGDWVLICLDWTEDEALDDPDIKEIDGEGEAGMGEGPWCICCCCDIPYGTPCTAIIEWLEGAPIPGAGDLRILIWLKWTKRDKIIYSK